MGVRKAEQPVESILKILPHGGEQTIGAVAAGEGGSIKREVFLFVLFLFCF